MPSYVLQYLKRTSNTVAPVFYTPRWRQKHYCKQSKSNPREGLAIFLTSGTFDNTWNIDLDPRINLICDRFVHPFLVTIIWNPWAFPVHASVVVFIPCSLLLDWIYSNFRMSGAARLVCLHAGIWNYSRFYAEWFSEERESFFNF